jgi:hypothetical protein
MLELGHYARFTCEEGKAVVIASANDGGRPGDGVSVIVAKTIVTWGDVNGGGSRAMMCDGSGGRTTWSGKYMRVLLAYDEEHGSMVIEGKSGRLGGVGEVDAMVLVKMFMREIDGDESKSHGGGVRTAHGDSPGVSRVIDKGVRDSPKTDD